MKTIILNHYYPHLTERVMLEVSDEIAVTLSIGGRLCDSYKRRKRPIEADDVGGSGDITNRADNVLKVERVPEEKVQELGYSTLLTILKNREFGARGKVKLKFNEPSRRLYPMGGSPAKKYGWERITT